MKRKIFSIVAFILLSAGSVAQAETGTSFSSTNGTTGQSSQTSSLGSGDSSGSASLTEQSSKADETVAPTPSSQQTASTTAQNQTNDSTSAPSSEAKQKQVTPTDGGAWSKEQINNTPANQSATKSSTTIINETVNNTGKGPNSWLAILTALSATVTIIGGLTALFRHFRQKARGQSVTKAVKKQEISSRQKERQRKKQNQNVEKSLTVSSVNRAVPEELSETQQMNIQADVLLKSYKKEKSFQRRRRN